MQTLARLIHHNHIITSIRQRPDASSIFLVTITDPNNDQIAHFETSTAIKSHTAALETGKRVLASFLRMLIKPSMLPFPDFGEGEWRVIPQCEYVPWGRNQAFWWHDRWAAGELPRTLEEMQARIPATNRFICIEFTPQANPD